MDAIFEGLALLVSWPASGSLMLGILLGLFFGAVPGLGGMVGFSILIPFTFGMDPVSAFALLLGMYALTTTSDSLSSVLIGVPGSGTGVTTVLDGYPMSQRGEAMRALGAAYTASTIGGVLGALMIAATLPFVRPVIVAFGPPEFFMLALLGLLMVSSLSGKAVMRGLAAAALGLLLATIGYSVQGGVTRYTLGQPYLLDGIKIIPVVLGLFAIPEIIDLAQRGRSISKVKMPEDNRGQIWQGIRDTFVHRWLALRGSLIGIYIGFLPGVGAAVSDWVAYGHAVQSAKDRSQFGKGDVRGIISSEAANSSVKGSDLVPTVALGIPGSAPMAILLGAFLIHGLQPGPMMLTRNLPFTYSLMWMLLIANVIGAIILMMWSRQLSKLIFVRGNLLVPGIILFAFMGAWMQTNNLGDWVTLLVFGVLGIWMKRSSWPRPPIILGYVLGPIMERNLDLSYQVLGWSWYGRPWVLVIFSILVLVMIFLAWRALRERRTAASRATEQVVMAEAPDAGARPHNDGAVALGLAAALLGVFGFAWWQAQPWTSDAGFFPEVAATAGIIFTALALVHATRQAYGSRALPLLPAGEAKAMAAMFLFLSGLIVGSILVGQMVAIPVLATAYLYFWAKEDWRLSIAYGGVCALILYFLFERLVRPIWITPMIPNPFW